MSTNKTTNYQLHSWLPTDEFHLTEINENFALLDAALKAEAGSREALGSALGERVRMVTGRYSGKGASTSADQVPLQITLGFRPRAVVIINASRGTSGVDLSYLGVESNANSSVVALTDTGFAVANRGSYLNYSGSSYQYAAFY